MSRLEQASNVILRVPGVVLLDLLYRWDVQEFTEFHHPAYVTTFFRAKYLQNIYYLAHLACAVLLLLPLRCLVSLYLYLLTVLLLYMAHQTARDYIRQEMESGMSGAVYEDPASLTRSVSVLTECCRTPYSLIGLTFTVSYMALGMLNLCKFFLLGFAAFHNGNVLHSVAECCRTPYSLIGLTFTVSYMALGMLNLCKFFLLGFAAFHNGNVLHRGVTEGVTLMMLALQTGLLDLEVLQRTFLLSIILFIVVASTLQSMIEIADPIVLALAATGNRSPWKHMRGIAVCLFLLVFPSFMAYKISHFFRMDFWLLILVSSCLLTSLQVLGTLFIYTLFMKELFQDSRVEQMDEIIYGVNAVSRVLEFLVALCVVAYGTLESMFGEWSWMGVSIIIVHSYFNLWLRARSGWKSFLLRKDASKKISALPRATKGQLRAHNDICSICFQEMSVAVITPCSHFFHANCLRKWLYVQDTCPLCHQQVKPSGAGRRMESQTQAEDTAAGSGNGRAAAEEEARPEVETNEEYSAGGQDNSELETAPGGHDGLVDVADAELVGK